MYKIINTFSLYLAIFVMTVMAITKGAYDIVN